MYGYCMSFLKDGKMPNTTVSVHTVSCVPQFQAKSHEDYFMNRLWPQTEKPLGVFEQNLLTAIFLTALCCCRTGHLNQMQPPSPVRSSSASPLSVVTGTN